MKVGRRGLAATGRARRIALAAVLLLFAGTVDASEVLLTQDAARADIRFFAGFLEDTHPDPYTPFGGRVEFQSEIQKMLGSVPEQGMSADRVYDLIRSFLGRMGDGHSYVRASSRRDDDSPPRYLPVRFKVAYDEVFVIEAKESHATLIGSRVRTAAGLDMDTLREAARRVFPKENRFAAIAYAVRLLGSDGQARRMMPDIEDRLAVRLVTHDGIEIDAELPYALSREERAADDWVGKRWDDVPDTNDPVITRIWEDRGAAYLGIRTIMAREAFEIMRLSGRTDLGEHLERFFERNLRREMPEAVDEAIAATPSICQTSHDLLSSLKEQKVVNLIVDLRGNGGGWSTIMKPLYYMLHGDRFFESDPVRYATRFSEGYLRILGADLASYNEKRGTSYELGDLMLNGGSKSDDPAKTRNEWLAELKESSPACHALISSLDGRPLYTPKRIFVITDPATFSAAYDTAYHLWRLGAKTVGVPPSQAAHSFVEGTPFTLPDSGLEGAISRTAVIYPDLPEKDNAFLLEYPMTWDMFRKHEFDLETEVLFILGQIQHEAREE